MPGFDENTRVVAVLRAVAAGRCEVTGGTEPDLFVDGLAFCDQMTAHAVVRAGLFRASRPSSLWEKVSAELTDAGRALLNGAVHIGGQGT